MIQKDIPCRLYIHIISMYVPSKKKHPTTPPWRCVALLRQGGGNAQEAAESAEVLELLALAALPEELELWRDHGGCHGDVMVLFHVIYIYIYER